MTIPERFPFRHQTVMAAMLSSLLLLACFMFRNTPEVHLILYFMLLVNLYASLGHPAVAIAGNLIIVMLCIAKFSAVWNYSCFGFLALVCLTPAVPVWHYRRHCRNEERYQQVHHDLTQKAGRLEKNRDMFEAERQVLEQDIEKIHQLYVLGRELVEHVEMGDVLEHLRRMLIGRPGVRSVAIIGWEKNAWSLLCATADFRMDRWQQFLEKDPSLRQERRFRILNAPGWIDGTSVVFWPVRLESELLAAIVLVTESDSAPRYIEEGKIFVPQIALGLMRSRLFAEVQERSRNDGLTGLYLRRYFLERLQTEIHRARRYGTAFSLIMIDIDHFKAINDRFGHLIGDKVLCSVARSCVDCVRPGDLVGRYGGEEFIVLLPMSDEDTVSVTAREISRMVSKREYAENGSRFTVTVSAGISTYNRDTVSSAEELIMAADQALYWVKTHGRNGVMRASALASSGGNPSPLS